MHYHAEIILGPGLPHLGDLERAIEQTMKPFYEGRSDDEDGMLKHAFWDFYDLGGRYSGDKLLQLLDQEKLAAFQQWLQDEKVTVSGLQWGKHELLPTSQIEKVDAKWNAFFPRPNGELAPCPLFKHAGPRYTGDILPLSECYPVKAATVMFAGPVFDHEIKEFNTGQYECRFLLQSEIWNGTTHQKTQWDGTIRHAVDLYTEHLKFMKDWLAEALMPRETWPVVTVDYHS